MGTTEEELEKAETQGFDTGLTVRHPFDTSWELPIYIANFILMDYGTGAIFGCPAHDQRDLDFARKYDLSVTRVVADGDGLNPKPAGGRAFAGDRPGHNTRQNGKPGPSALCVGPCGGLDERRTSQQF